METVLSPPQPFLFDERSIDLASGKLSDSWKKWKKGFQIYFEACELQKKSAVIQLNIFLHIVGEQCREIIDQFKEITLEGVLKKLDEHFGSKKNLTVERHKFFIRNQQESETIDQYVFELKKLALTCEFCDLKDDLIKDRLVCGVISSAIRERLLREDKLTLYTAVEICRVAIVSRMYSEDIKKESVVYKIEESNRHEESNDIWMIRGHRGYNNMTPSSSRVGSGSGYVSRSIRGRSVSEHRGSNRRETRGRSGHASRTSNRLRPTPVCDRCGRIHEYNACPAYGRTCLRCSKLNHFAKVCRVYEVGAPNPQSMTAYSVINSLKDIFSRQGIPNTVMSDCGPQFTASEFRQFAHEWNFTHETSSPYYHQSNGQIERTVQTVKNILKKSLEDNSDYRLGLLECLNTPVSNIIPSPAELLQSRKFRSIVPTPVKLFNSKSHVSTQQKLRVRQQKQKMYYDKGSRNLIPLSTNQKVRIYDSLKSIWVSGTILTNLGNRSYRIRLLNGKVIVRNRRHIIKDLSPAQNPPQEYNFDYDHIMYPCQYTNVNNTCTSSDLYVTRSGRTVRPPNRWGYT
ncbi:unnamed protein product [Arctia plantaginis]|uniref:Integrase catalytic domain-containing protein n=2 Tax=Arctia plantaginis TaxID=874455 RepID=A0A8S0ZGE3_ARCPL|nr:unnamed protein product [Arctia plantaginis]